ncbi:hypothetical protein L7F22_045148 [Adiantum nelumboides]|nr:hypothetical protein [Adiantum nelumboides]
MNVSCSCPPEYTPISSEDYSKGCSSTRSPPGCSGPIAVTIDRVVMKVQPHTDYYYNDLMLLTDFDLEHCKNSCLSNCACIAASYSESRRSCYLKGNETLGYLSIGWSSADHPMLLMKLSLPSEPADNGRGQWVVVVAVAVMMGALVPTAIILGFLWRRRCAGSKKLMWCRRTDTLEIRVSSLQQLTFDYQEPDATKNFSFLIGEGGFGRVYKGWIAETRIWSVRMAAQQKDLVVAVKVLKQGSHKRPGQDTREKKQLRAAGSLDTYLCPRHRQEPLPWSIRYSIAAGIACGLAYLHHDCNPPILHFDIKPQNVLLDDDFTPKVGDFGLATRFCEPNQTHLTMSTMRGTCGYMAPEWLKSDRITSKADVYSYGMVLLELVHGLNSRKGMMTFL